MKFKILCAMAASATVLSAASAGFASIVVSITTNTGTTQLTSTGSNTFASGSFGGFSWQSITVTQSASAGSTEFALDVAGLSNTTANPSSITFAGTDNNFSLGAGSSATLLMADGSINSFANGNASVSISGSAQDVAPAGTATSAAILTNQSTGTGTLYAVAGSSFANLNPAVTGNFSLGNTLVVNNLPAVQVVNDINGASAVNALATISTPEPMSLAIVSLGLLPLVLLRRRARA